MTDGAVTIAPRTPAEWVRAVAGRAGLTVPDVQAILDRHGIEPRPTLPRARTLKMRSVAFSGTKDGTAADGPFAFERMDLGPGLWAMMSDRNSRGKSSVLNVVRAAVRGDFPGPLKPDVWRWIGALEVAFDIDAVGFRTLVEKEPGEERAERARVCLARRQGDDWIDLYDGPAGPGLETQVEALFMEELGFARFHAFNAPSGTGHTHGWAAISAGLFVTGPRPGDLRRPRRRRDAAAPPPAVHGPAVDLHVYGGADGAEAGRGRGRQAESRHREACPAAARAARRRGERARAGARGAWKVGPTGRPCGRAWDGSTSTSSATTPRRRPRGRVWARCALRKPRSRPPRRRRGARSNS